MTQERPTEKKRLLFQGIVRLNSRMIGLTVGLVLGAAIFMATNFLLIKGGYTRANGQYVVGPHLWLLSQFFMGYKVSFFGSIIGFIYGFVVGALGGAAIGWIYNRIVQLRH